MKMRHHRIKRRALPRAVVEARRKELLDKLEAKGREPYIGSGEAQQFWGIRFNRDAD